MVVPAEPLPEAFELPEPVVAVCVVADVCAAVGICEWKGFACFLRSAKPRSCPVPAADDGVIVATAAALTVAVAEVSAGVLPDEPPLIIFRSFGPWMNPMISMNTPRTIAAVRARRSRIWAGVGRRDVPLGSAPAG